MAQGFFDQSTMMRKSELMRAHTKIRPPAIAGGHRDRMRMRRIAQIGIQRCPKGKNSLAPAEGYK